MYDAVVIGASSAGLLAAEKLARAGKKVVLVERQERIAPAERTYIITPGIFRVVPDLPASLIRHKISKLNIRAAEVFEELKLPDPDLVIDRRELILYLLDQAREAGVEVISGAEFTEFKQIGDVLKVSLRIGKEDQELTTRYLIGADGAVSQVRKAAGYPDIQTVPLLQVVISQDGSWDDKTAVVWFDTKRTPYFFWLIPDKDDQAVVGLIASAEKDPREALDAFLQEKGFIAQGFQSGQAALYSRQGKSVLTGNHQGVYLVGDAAGQVKVTTVGGTVTGFEGALAVVSAILGEGTYQRSISRLNRELRLHQMIRALLDQMTDKDYRNLLINLSAAIKNHLRRYDRDKFRGKFFVMAILQPRFIPLGFKLLLSWFFSSFRPQ